MFNNYLAGYPIGGGLQILQSHNEFEENLLMDDLDIDDLLECEDIESTAFISSSKQLLSVIDNLVNCIDDRISYKKGGGNGYFATRNGGYFGGAGSGYHQEDFAPGSAGGIQFNNNLDGYRHKH